MGMITWEEPELRRAVVLPGRRGPRSATWTAPRGSGWMTWENGKMVVRVEMLDGGARLEYTGRGSLGGAQRLAERLLYWLEVLNDANDLGVDAHLDSEGQIVFSHGPYSKQRIWDAPMAYLRERFDWSDLTPALRAAIEEEISMREE